MKNKYLPLILFCTLDIFLPFFSFFLLLERNWSLITTVTSLSSQGWLIAPASILVLVAIVFIYITSQQFPTEQRKAWWLLGSVVFGLAVMVVSSGRQWQAGLFQYGLLELLCFF